MMGLPRRLSVPVSASNQARTYWILACLIVGSLLLATQVHLREASSWSPAIADTFSAVLASTFVLPTQKHHQNDHARIKILHLIDYDTFTSLMDRWFVRSHQAFANRNDLVESAVLWGKGFPGYNSSLSIEDNIGARYGRQDHFQAILPYYNIDQTNVLAINPRPFFNSLKHLSNLGVIVVDRPHEMRQSRRVDMLHFSNVSLVACSYGYECDDYAHFFGKQSLIVHQPHPVDTDLFFHSVSRERPNAVLVAGNLEPENYPLRHRLAKMVRDGHLPGENRQHPQYADILSPEEKSANNVSEHSMEQQLRDYSRSLANAKICIVTASKFGYAVQKYGEAAASGCLIMGTIPNERQYEFKSFVVPLSNNQTDVELRDTIEWWLTHDKERIDRARLGQEYFLRHFTQDAYAEDLVTWIQLARKGQRGTIYPYTWTRPVYPLANDG